MANKYTDNTRKYLLSVYKKFGVEVVIKSAYQMLCSSTLKYDKEFQTGLHGEICETVLEILLREFIRKNKIKDWYISKSLVIPANNTTTELDITLFTPKCIYIFECKCYYGNKELHDICTIKRQGQSDFDIYKQNLFHKDMVHSMFGPLRYIKEDYSQDIRLIFFDFSNGTMRDLRSIDSRHIMPLTSFHNLYTIFNNYGDLPIQWDVDGVVKAVKVLESQHDKLMALHLKRLKRKYK